MRYLKLHVPVGCVALVLTMLLGAGSSSATVLCSENKIPCPVGKDYEFNTVIAASLEAGTTMVLRDTSSMVVNKCTGSKLESRTENTGAKGVPIKTEITKLTFEGCSFKTVVTLPGWLDLDYAGGLTDTKSILTLKTTEITVNVLGVDCVYGAEIIGSNVGLFKGGNPAKMEIFGGSLAKREGPMFCPSHIVAEGKYTVNAPKPLYTKDKNEGE